jgi:deazaflavin-dependent oxidoreductase (nitroreductase family)
MTLDDRTRRLPPAWLRRSLVNPLVRTIVRHVGMGRNDGLNAARVLQVAGRRTGRLYDVPVLVATRDRQRFVVSLFGESQWGRNLRASGEAHLLARGTREKVRAREILGREKQEFLAWYIQQRGNQITTPRITVSAVSTTEMERLTERFPIFRLDPLG